MLITIKLTANDGRETELAEFGVIIDGFKSLADLNKDLQLAGSTEVGKHLGKVFRNAPDGDKLSQMSTVPVQAWIEKVQMGIRRLVAAESKHRKRKLDRYRLEAHIGRRLCARPVFRKPEVRSD